MTAGRNVMIRASAGSGKTFALTNRYVELLAGSAKPERIAALTFTRKAAGEFFDEILRKLAKAASDEASAGRLAASIGKPALGSGDFLRMLRAVVEAMPRLRLGTLDGFFARLVRVFPMELGLAGDFDVLEEHEAEAERRRVLQRLFAGEEQSQERKDFIEAFKRSSFGEEGKRFGPQMDRFLQDHLEVFLAAPDGGLWGNPGAIWPEGCPWLASADPDWKRASEAVRTWLATGGPDGRQRRRWEDFLAAVETWEPGAPVPRALGYILERASEPAAWKTLQEGRGVLAFDRRRQELPAGVSAALAELVRGVFRGVLVRKLESTHGIHAVLAAYDRHYDLEVRRAGRLTFGDVQRLLEPGALGPPGGGDDPRLALDYRIDGEIDHWLLDEFQDTNRGQWKVLQNLVDEAVQDGRRSFFCVGDIKQSIYSWRGGDPRLFREILDHYNGADPHAIATRHLDESWRSGPAVIDMVNAVFGDAAVLSALYPGSAGAAWTADWRPHRTAVPERDGQAALLHGTGEQQRWRTALAILRELRPHERGMTCAVLVPDNKAVVGLADTLRREGALPAVSESDTHACGDNPLGAAMLALFQAGAHPGDRLAWEHLRMTPFGRILRSEGLEEPAALSTRILGQVHAEGFERTAEAWLRLIEPALDPKDGFSRQRARQFAEAAGLFDATASRSIDAFQEFMKGTKVRDAEAAGTIRVMTIHKSKGLGFDVVVLPDLEGKTLLERRRGLAVQRGARGSVDWILDLPPSPFSEADPVLNAHLQGARAEGCHEKLSLLYVAMTRAKRALYAIVEPLKEGSEARGFPRLLSETLGRASGRVAVGALALEGARSFGNPAWFEAFAAPERPVRAEAAMPTAGAGAAPAMPRRPARRPSAARQGAIPAGTLFAAAPVAEHGSAVHAILARIPWSKPEAMRLEGAPPDPAAAEARSCLASPELAPVWAEPAGGGQAWCERSFEVVLDGEWVTGRFDRVVVAAGADGRPAAATVYDFKTDRLAPGADLAAEALRHAGQLGWYRRAAAALTGLPLEAVACEVVFTMPKRKVKIAP